MNYTTTPNCRSAKLVSMPPRIFTVRASKWHYRISPHEEHRNRTARRVIRMLAGIVSKNGNLPLSIPLRGDGSIDEDESRLLDGLASGMPASGLVAALPKTKPNERNRQAGRVTMRTPFRTR